MDQTNQNKEQRGANQGYPTPYISRLNSSSKKNIEIKLKARNNRDGHWLKSDRLGATY
jgi:hypothetical protein